VVNREKSTVSAARWIVILAVLSSVGGCYTYQPIRPVDAVADSHVRATVSSKQAVELQPVLRNVTPQVVGTVVGLEGSSLLMDVPMVGQTPGVSRAPVYNRVRLPLDDLVSLESRSLSRWRTGVTVGSVVAAVAAGWVVLSGETKVDDKGKTGTDNAVRIRIPIGFSFR